MSKLLCKNYGFLKNICSSKNKKFAIKSASSSNIRALCEICLNILRGHLPVDKVAKNKLKKHRPVIEKLAKRSGSLKSKKLVLVNQRGGFVGVLANLALPIVASLVAGVLKKKSKNKQK